MKTAVVVLADGFEEIEAVTPIDLLRRAGVRVVVAGLSGRSVVGARGVAFGCDTTLDQVEPGWDALVLPGGMPGAKNLAQSPLVKQCIERTLAGGQWLAAICAAPAVVLGAQGYLKGKKFTGYPGTETTVTDAFFQEAPVVVDGRLITSRGVGTAGAFALKLVEVLAGSDKAAETARAVLLPVNAD